MYGNKIEQLSDHQKIKKLKISVLGCGNGGMALAAYLLMQGHDVRIWSSQSYSTKLWGLIDGTGIVVTGAFEGLFHVRMATVDLTAATEDADVIIMCLPRPAHQAILKMLLHSKNRENQILFILPGKFSSIELQAYAKKAQIKLNMDILETNTFPYACRANLSGDVEILGVKKTMGIASNSREQTTRILNKIGNLFPTQLEIYEDTIQLGLESAGAIIHSVNTFFSAARIDNGDHNFFFYKDGISKKTSRVHSKIDEERMTICKLYGYKARSYVEIYNELYGENFQTMYDFITQSTVYNKQKLVPRSLEHRYVNEDVLYTLSSWYALGKKRGFIAKTMESIIYLFSLINEKDYFANAKYIDDFEIPSKHNG
jgi:opine dehydrogenase